MHNKLCRSRKKDTSIIIYHGRVGVAKPRHKPTSEDGNTKPLRLHSPTNSSIEQPGSPVSPPSALPAASVVAADDAGATMPLLVVVAATLWAVRWVRRNCCCCCAAADDDKGLDRARVALPAPFKGGGEGYRQMGVS